MENLKAYKKISKNHEIDKCSKCTFAIPNLEAVPMTYSCFSPYDKGIKCKFGIGVL